PAPVVDSGRNIDPVALRLLGDPLASAGGTGVIDDLALAAAFGAGLRDREEALALGIDPGALAARTGSRRGARLGSAAAAGRAWPGGRYGDGDLSPVHGLVEGEANLGLEVSAAQLARALLLASASEEGGEDVADVGGEATAGGAAG